MKATYKGEVADVWQVSKDNRNSPDWVKEAFAKRYFCWLDNHLRVLTAGLKPSTVKSLKTGAIGSLGGGFAGYGMYELAYLGIILILPIVVLLLKKHLKRNIRLLIKRVNSFIRNHPKTTAKLWLGYCAFYLIMSYVMLGQSHNWFHVLYYLTLTSIPILISLQKKK